MKLNGFFCILGGMLLSGVVTAETSYQLSASGKNETMAEASLKTVALRTYLKTVVNDAEMKSRAKPLRSEIFLHADKLTRTSNLVFSGEGGKIHVTGSVAVDDQKILAVLKSNPAFAGLTYFSQNGGDDAGNSKDGTPSSVGSENKTDDAGVKPELSEPDNGKSEVPAGTVPENSSSSAEFSENKSESSDAVKYSRYSPVMPENDFIGLIISLKKSPEAREKIVVALNQGMDPNCRRVDENGRAWGDPAFVLLMQSVAAKDPELVTMFIEKGADLLWKSDRDEYRSMQYLFYYPELVSANAGLMPSLKGVRISHYTPAAYLLTSQKPEQLDFELLGRLMDLGNDTDAREGKDSSFDTLTRLAIGADRSRLYPTELLAKIIDAGADPNRVNRSGQSAVFRALELKASEHLKMLKEKGADINLEDRDGNSPLFYAINGSRNDDQTVEYLIGSGADLNFKSHRRGDMTPLMLAVREKRTAVAAMLIKAGADINLQDSRNKSALIYAINNSDEKTDLEILELLLKAGANPNLADKDNNPPLIYAIKSRRAAEVAVLVEHGADLKSALDIKVRKQGKEITFYDSLMQDNDEKMNPVKEYINSVLKK